MTKRYLTTAFLLLAVVSLFAQMMNPVHFSSKLKMLKGDEAEIVIPSRLAYGLTGDGDKIPCMATLVYKLKVIEHQTNY